MMTQKLMRPLFRNALNLNQLCYRSLTNGVSRKQQVLEQTNETNDEMRIDEQWINAKDYETMPGPTRFEMLRDFLPGGKLQKANHTEMNKILRERYGDIYRMKGIQGKPDYVFTYNPDDIERTYRNEGIWPKHLVLETMTYYRKQKRPDLFHGFAGLLFAQGEEWANIRNKLNPILMKVQIVKQYLPQVDEIAAEFITRMEELRHSGTLTAEFVDQLKMWALESMSYIALNTRMGLMTDNPDPNALLLDHNLVDLFRLSYIYDVQPSFWKYIETPGFKRLMKVHESVTDISVNYVEKAIKNFEAEGNKEAKSILEKLYRIDKTIAIVMAMDMLMAGIDTTSSTLISLLYRIARNPDKQEILRSELKSIMPHKNTPLNEQNTKNLPYLRACIKESLRVSPVTPGNMRIAVKDLVLSGYKVPKGTAVLMNLMVLSNTEKYFPRCGEFLPERWLKSGPSACPEAKATHPFVYLPFGFGPRTCIGKRLAEMEIETLMSKIIRNYHVTWESTEDLKYSSNFVLLPTGNMPFKFEPVE